MDHALAAAAARLRAAYELADVGDLDQSCAAARDVRTLLGGSQSLTAHADVFERAGARALDEMAKCLIEELGR